MLFTHLLRVRDVFVVIVFFIPPYTVCYCFTYFPFSKFCVMCRIPTDEEPIPCFPIFFLSPPVFFLPILYGCCCSFSSWKQFHHPFFSVAIYSHANECSVRFTVFESAMICCEFFLS